MGRKPNPSRRRPLLGSFFKVMFGDFAHKVLLPPAYAQRYRGILPRQITLTTCDGKRVQVIMSQIENNLFFRAGWSDFVQDKSLNSGDFLVFDNVAESEFNVSIFRIKTRCLDNLLRENIHSGGSMNENKADKLKRRKPNIMYGKDRADRFVPDRPFFKVCMKDSHIKETGGAYLHIPTTFVKKYISRKVQNVTLRTTMESAWVARLSFDRRHYVRMTTGWDEFVTDNNLQVEDVCFFELINRCEIVLQVYIFR